MKKSEFSAAAALAFDYTKDLSNVDDAPLFGCGLSDFKPIFVTLEQVAKFIRWQCSYVNAVGHDADGLAECAGIAREKFTLIQPLQVAPDVRAILSEARDMLEGHPSHESIETVRAMLAAAMEKAD